MRLLGEQEFRRNMNQLKDRLVKRVFRSAVAKGARQLVKATKASIDAVDAVDTKLLRQSIGFRVITYKTGFVGAVIGPRKNYRRMVRIVGKRKKKLKALSGKKTAEAEAAGEKLKWRNPVKYAHLVEFGTRSAAAKPFMRYAYDGAKMLVEQIIYSAVRQGLREQAAKLKVTGKGP